MATNKRKVLLPDTMGREGVDIIRARDDIDRPGLRDRLAGIACFERGEFVIALAQDLDCAAQDARALHRRERGPFALAVACGLHRAIDVGRRGLLHGRERFAGGGVERVEGLATSRVDVGAAYIETLRCEYRHDLLLF